MENRGLLFIPDISGFTKFVTETEIDHSRMIIQELLEILIDANEEGLEISEIEGDAILFYKYGDAPDLEDLYKQVERMFCAFHRNINAYALRKYCQCTACLSAVDLSLKIITHYGEFTTYNVKSFSKLIGKDVIIAHQLLKNEIEYHEYWLVTQNLLHGDKPGDFTDWMKWHNGDKQTETGKISFKYTWLSKLKKDLSSEVVPQPDIGSKTKLLSLSREYETDIIRLFHITGDFNYRNLWQEGVARVEKTTHLLPRVGMRCRCIMRNGEVVPFSSKYYNYREDKIEFCETNEKDGSVTWFTLERTGDDRTRLTMDLYLPKKLAASIIFRLTKKNKTIQAFGKSLDNLIGVVKNNEIG